MTTTKHALDPVTLEILTNRLWITNDEAAATLRRVSGSPVATEICDFNTALMRADGEAFMVGTYMSPLSMGHHFIVKSIIRDYSENPGFGPGDMFICSDPYRGNTHQNDVTVVAPVHVGDRLIAWTGISVHQVDVGGPVYGSQASVGATSIFQEALPMPPMRIVEGGVLRRDLEEEYLIRSRTRDLNALDLRAKIAANALARDRIVECAERYGVDTLVEAIDAIIDVGEERLRRRLSKLPDGTWRHRSYMDEAPGRTHDFRLEMTKSGDRLTLDFGETGPQAGAIYNCTRGGLVGGVLSSVLPILFYGMPWCPASALRVVDVLSEPGTLVDAQWPAGTCKATTAAIATVNTITNVCLGKLMATASEDELRDRSMAAWMTAATVQELGGVDQRGEPFGATMLDPMAGGGGARGDRDGIDNGGVVRAVKLRIANVETYEFRYPLLYLHRRRLVDSGGAGANRGGVGVSLMFTPHGVDGIPTNVMHSINYQAPATAGIAGGHPGATNSMAVLRGSDLWEHVAAGRLPVDLDALHGELEVIPMMASSDLARGDVYRSATGGGGGWGDPLERRAQAVAADVLAGAVSEDEARLLYGVVLDGQGRLDAGATEDRRGALRRERLELAAAPRAPLGVEPVGGAEPVGHALALYRVDGEQLVGCRCGQLLGAAGTSHKAGLGVIEEPATAAGRGVDPFRLGTDFVFRRYVCPSCALLVETEVARRGDPPLADAEIGRTP